VVVQCCRSRVVLCRVVGMVLQCGVSRYWSGVYWWACLGLGCLVWELRFVRVWMQVWYGFLWV